MDFRFSQDQLDFQGVVKSFLAGECTPEHLRNLLEVEARRDAGRWQKLTDIGLTGFFVPEGLGGMGLNELDFVLIAEACGAAALPETLVEQAAVAAPLLAACPVGEVRDKTLLSFVQGSMQLALQLPNTRYVHDLHVAESLIFSGDDLSVRLSSRDQVSATPQNSIDPFRRLFDVQVGDGEEIASDGSDIWERAFERGALFSAAQLVGLAQTMIDMAVTYTQQLTQFGKPIGSFQAVKHHLASAQVSVSFAQPVVYRAAYAVAHNAPKMPAAVSHAKIAAGDAAMIASKAALQCHGAMGYTFEAALHLWMKRSWALIGAWGDRDFHLKRVSDFVLGATMPTFADLACGVSDKSGF